MAIAERLVELFKRRSERFLIRVNYITVLVIGLMDYLTGSELSFFILYLIPVSLAASFTGRNAAFLISIESALVWLSADLLAGRSYSHAFIPIWNGFVRLVFLLLVAALQSALSREKFFARTDSLTGLANRRHFFELSEKEIERARRYNLPISLAYVDIDDFKAINDTLGHDAGDRLLETVGGIMKVKVRATDIPARLGGDEFAVLLPHTESDAAMSVISKLSNYLTESVSVKKWPVTFSFGVITFVKPPESMDEMIKKADELMYKAKNEGKDKIKYEVYGL